MTASNPFASAEAWEVSTERILGDGNHVVKITGAEDGSSSGGHPQIELQLANDQGEIRDWMVITKASVGKVVSLATAAGVEIPSEDDIADTSTLRLKQAWIDKLVGKTVGIVVRDEPSFKDPKRMISRVQGYVTPDRIKGYKDSDVTGAGDADPFASVKSKVDPEMPF